MTSARPLRVVLVANDGFSAGHVARALAVARGLVRTAARRGIGLRLVLATTSEAHALLAAEPVAVVRLPGPAAARRAGFSDVERRRLVHAALDGAIQGFDPDLIVVDSFPSGPHGELAGIDHRARRALVRRTVPEVDDRGLSPGGSGAEGRRGLIDADAMVAGLGGYDLAILAGDPAPQRTRLPIATLQVPPITLDEAGERLGRAAARMALGLPGGRAILVAAGGGGDLDAAERACAIACAVARIAPEVTPVLAHGPLAPEGAAVPGGAVRVIRIAPLAPLLAAFDGAFAPAGYNTAHELAAARVPTALFAQPRPFDDQAGRAARFAAAGFACALASTTDEAIAAALAWMDTARVPELVAGGADRAAEGLIDLATGHAIRVGRPSAGAPR